LLYNYIVYVNITIASSIYIILHGKNDFAEESKILLDTDLKIIVRILKTMSNAAKNFDILATGLSVLRNYFDNSTNFSDLHLAQILDLSAKLFFPYNQFLERLMY